MVNEGSLIVNHLNDQATPCIIFTRNLYMKNRMSAATPLNTINTVKNVNRLSIGMPKKDGMCVDTSSPAPGGINELSVPANLLAAAFAKNQVPINNELKRKGASFETIDNPIGDRHS